MKEYIYYSPEKNEFNIYTESYDYAVMEFMWVKISCYNGDGILTDLGTYKYFLIGEL